MLESWLRGRRWRGCGPAGQGDPGQRRRRGRATDGAAVGSFAQHRRGLAARRARDSMACAQARAAPWASSGQGGQSSARRCAAKAATHWSADGWPRGSGFGSHRASHLAKVRATAHRVETSSSAATQFDSIARHGALSRSARTRAGLCVDEKSRSRRNALSRRAKWRAPPHDHEHSPRPPPRRAEGPAAGPRTRTAPSAPEHASGAGRGTRRGLTAAHPQHPAVKRWLAAHRASPPLTPTSALAQLANAAPEPPTPPPTHPPSHKGSRFGLTLKRRGCVGQLRQRSGVAVLVSKGVILPPVLAGQSRRPRVEQRWCGVRRSPGRPQRVLFWPRGIGAGHRGRKDEVGRVLYL